MSDNADVARARETLRSELRESFIDVRALAAGDMRLIDEVLLNTVNGVSLDAPENIDSMYRAAESAKRLAAQFELLYCASAIANAADSLLTALDAESRSKPAMPDTPAP